MRTIGETTSSGKSSDARTGLLAVAFAGTLAACQSGATPAGPPIANGNWASSDGVYTALFSNGSFTATANDTGEVLSRGRYIVKSENQLRIEWFGNVSRTSNSAECTKPDNDTMNCLDKNGRNFVLRRSAQS